MLGKRQEAPHWEENVIGKHEGKTFIAGYVKIILKIVLRKESVTVYFAKEAWNQHECVFVHK